jgi:hypothetical protein
VVILVSLPDQLLYVYRNGVRIGRSTVSTGKPGKRTPTGVFTVLQKKVRHESSIYKAQMPHMQRLTWTGIAMHAGHLPDYPASAGCVRLPVDFGQALHGHNHRNDCHIADNNSAPKESVKPGLLFSGNTGTAAKGFKWTPEKGPKVPVSIIVSAPGTTLIVTNLPVDTSTKSALESLKGKRCCRKVKFYSGVFPLTSRWSCLSRILRAGPRAWNYQILKAIRFAGTPQ